MEKVFHDKFSMACSFTEKGIFFSNSLRDVFFPYGSIDQLNLSLLGVMQAVSHSLVCCFTVNKQDKAEIKALVKQAKEAIKEAIKAAPSGEAVVLDHKNVPVDLNQPAADRLKQYKALFVQGVITKDQYDLEKKLLSE